MIATKLYSLVEKFSQRNSASLVCSFSYKNIKYIQRKESPPIITNLINKQVKFNILKSYNKFHFRRVGNSHDDVTSTHILQRINEASHDIYLHTSKSNQDSQCNWNTNFASIFLGVVIWGGPPDIASGLASITSSTELRAIRLLVSLGTCRFFVTAIADLSRGPRPLGMTQMFRHLSYRCRSDKNIKSYIYIKQW